MGRTRRAVLAYVRAHPGATDYGVWYGAYDASAGLMKPSLPESTVKQLLRLRDAGLVRSVGSPTNLATVRTWWPV